MPRIPDIPQTQIARARAVAARLPADVKRKPAETSDVFRTRLLAYLRRGVR